MKLVIALSVVFVFCLGIITSVWWMKKDKQTQDINPTTQTEIISENSIDPDELDNQKPEKDTENKKNYWRPTANNRWQLQLSETFDNSIEADVYFLDLFDTPEATIDSLHARNKKVICYVSVGSWEDWRTDKDKFPKEILGDVYEGYENERWLDIRAIDELIPILKARFDLCQQKGFDGVDPDNVNGFENNTSFQLTADDQLIFNRFIADEAHKRGLAVGLKNDADQAPQLVNNFDWILTEDCFNQGWCDQVAPFIKAGKPAFVVEYTDLDMTTNKFCAEAEQKQYNAILKHRTLDAWREEC